MRTVCAWNTHVIRSLPNDHISFPLMKLPLSSFFLLSMWSLPRARPSSCACHVCLMRVRTLFAHRVPARVAHPSAQELTGIEFEALSYERKEISGP
jgi:hypothetical protein